MYRWVETSHTSHPEGCKGQSSHTPALSDHCSAPSVLPTGTATVSPPVLGPEASMAYVTVTFGARRPWTGVHDLKKIPYVSTQPKLSFFFSFGFQKMCGQADNKK